MSEFIRPAHGQNGAMVRIGRVSIGGGESVKVMGIINASPESFYKDSVKTSGSDIAAAARLMQRAGAHIIDVGGMSTAPYLQTLIPVEKEIDRVNAAIKAVKEGCDLPISVDTPRAQVAAEATRLGADAINDVTGLKHDSKMAHLVAGCRVPVIIGAYSTEVKAGTIQATMGALRQSISIAKNNGIESEQLIVDPSVGFFRESGTSPFFTRMTDMPWYARDIEVISKVEQVTKLAPTCISVSGKSFIGELLNIRDPKDRLVPSIACEVYAALHGASIIRTHNVRETVEAITMAGMF